MLKTFFIATIYDRVSGKVVFTTGRQTDKNTLHETLRKSIDEIGKNIHAKIDGISYFGDNEYEEGEEYIPEERCDINKAVLTEIIEYLIRDSYFDGEVFEAYIDSIKRLADETANDDDIVGAVYFQAEILDSYDESVICTTSPYSKKEIVYQELRGEIDKIGKVIAEEVDDCQYLGNVDYEEGKEFNDHHERWDFNRETLSDWIETAIEVGNYDGPLVDIRIETNEILDQYVPTNALPVQNSR